MAKKKSYKDPHAAREASRYENPVPSRELILQVLNDQGRPMLADELMKHLKIDGEESQIGIERRLGAMIRDGQLVQNRKREFGVISRMDLICGRVQGHRDGFGFVIPDGSTGGDDLFISPRQMQAVMDGDKVLVNAEGRNRFGKREARIVEVVERAVTELVGVFRREAGAEFLVPQNKRISKEVLVGDRGGLTPEDGDHVRAEIVQYSGRERHVLVKLCEIIASPDEPGMEVDVALRNFDIPYLWPQDAEREANALADEVLEKDKKGRVDLRELPLVTIDGEDARDFDDAVYVEARKRGGWRLVVAIADVSHYVRPASGLDVEANKRGTSVYFPRRVVPMLPEKISNGLCSLNPNVDRLCLFCDMQISAAGKITSFSFAEGVMRSRYRLTYTQVGALIEEPEGAAAQKLQADIDAPTQDGLWQFYALYQALRSQRDSRGAIDFETTETRILYDDFKKISAIVPVVRNVAHKMIEEAMLAANICAANLLEKSETPSLFRNHEPPKGDKLDALQQFLGPLGLKIDWGKKGGEPTPEVFKSLTEKIATRPDRSVIQTVMLRSLKQAKYEAENKGHFGLAYKAYAHFTSPIRRYPDLLVHRAIRYLIRTGKGGDMVTSRGMVANTLAKMSKAKTFPYQISDMVALGEHCSLTERRADEATRDVVQWLKCQYMQQHLGDSFSGVIAAVTSFGVFVLIDDLFIEGLVHISSLDSDYYHYDNVRHALVGESSGRQFRLGDAIQVKVAAVHIDDRKIDLAMGEGAVASDAKGSVRSALAAGKIPAKGKGGGRGSASKAGAVRGRGKAAGKVKGAAAKVGGEKGANKEADKKTSGGKSAPAGKARASKGPPRGRKSSRRRPEKKGE
jgi:ribonuclease R